MAVIADNSARPFFMERFFLSFGHDTARIAPGDFPAASPEPFARKILEQGRHAVLPGQRGSSARQLAFTMKAGMVRQV